MAAGMAATPEYSTHSIWRRSNFKNDFCYQPGSSAFSIPNGVVERVLVTSKDELLTTLIDCDKNLNTF